MKKWFLCMIAILLVASCSKDEFADKEVANVQSEKCTLRLKVKSFEANDDAETRAWFDFRQNKFCDFYFESGDLFGVCALDGSFNSPYPCLGVVDEDECGELFVTIDATQLHGMLRGKECVAYYPYDAFHKPDNFNVWFYFDKQKQVDDTNSYLANNNVFLSEIFNFDNIGRSPEIEMQPANSIIDVLVPLSNLTNGKYRKIELVSADAKMPFTQYVRYSINEDGFSEPDTMKAWKSGTTSLDISEMNVTSGEHHFYFACFPSSNFGKIIVRAITDKGVVYSSEEISVNKNNKCLAGYGYRMKVKSMKMESKPKYGTENGYEYVDLGLPSGLKWAKMNLGAVSVTDYGKYYSWGETKAYKEEDLTNLRNYIYNTESSSQSSQADPYVKRICSEETYKWCNGKMNSLTKYCLDRGHGIPDNKVTLSTGDDAAAQNWGGSWHIPSYTDMKELFDNCYCVWTDGYNGTDVEGYIIYKALSDSHKGLVVTSGQIPEKKYNLLFPHIFLPLPGSYYLTLWGTYASGHGTYWTSLLSDGDDLHAFAAWATSDEFKIGRAYRCESHSIRAVCK